MSRGVIGLVIAAILLIAPRPGAASSATTLMVGAQHNMQATLIAPDGPGPYPGILVLHTSGGLSSADVQFAQRLADQGYVCLVPAFLAAYHITPGGRAATFTTYADKIYADFVAAIDTVRRSDKVRGGKVGVVGFSNGGYFAVWLSETAKVDAGISYYGAFSGAGSDRDLVRFQQVAAANGAPLLILHGQTDKTVPVGTALHLDHILANAHAPHEIRVYDSAGHEFDRNGESSDAASDAWRRTLAFFAMHLKQP